MGGNSGIVNDGETIVVGTDVEVTKLSTKPHQSSNKISIEDNYIRMYDSEGLENINISNVSIPNDINLESLGTTGVADSTDTSINPSQDISYNAIESIGGFIQNATSPKIDRKIYLTTGSDFWAGEDETNSDILVFENKTMDYGDLSNISPIFENVIQTANIIIDMNVYLNVKGQVHAQIGQWEWKGKVWLYIERYNDSFQKWLSHGPPYALNTYNPNTLIGNVNMIRIGEGHIKGNIQVNEIGKYRAYIYIPANAISHTQIPTDGIKSVTMQVRSKTTVEQTFPNFTIIGNNGILINSSTSVLAMNNNNIMIKSGWGDNEANIKLTNDGNSIISINNNGSSLLYDSTGIKLIANQLGFSGKYLNTGYGFKVTNSGIYYCNNADTTDDSNWIKWEPS